VERLVGKVKENVPGSANSCEIGESLAKLPRRVSARSGWVTGRRGWGRPDVRVLGDDYETVTGALAERGSEFGLRNIPVQYGEALNSAVVLQD
jgi:hypothetical protein